MNSLSTLPFRLSYRTGRDDLVRDFLNPALTAAVQYRRAAGYFTSAGLALAARGVANLASRGGTMQLVVSPYLEPDDVQALQAADRPAEVLRAIAARSLADLEDALLRDRLNALAWLAAAGLLDIRLALRLDAQGQVARGLFHEKTGILTDQQGHHVAFSGSANETAGGLLENFESIKVFCSWRDAEGRVQEEIDNFTALWNNATPGLRVIEFSAAGRELLERFRDGRQPPPGLLLAGVAEPTARRLLSFHPPPGFQLRPYQAEAIRAWLKAGGKGVFAMATGSGKTATALTLASKVAEKNQPLVVLIVCPFINLCRQWLRELAAFGVLETVPCFEGQDRWQARLEEGYQRLAVGLTPVLALVATHATFQSEGFQSRLRPRLAAGAAHHLLIADEVHNLGAERGREALPEAITLRLGLSATPERHYDPVGTAAVLAYFGGPVYTYSLSQAIADGCLCPYRYYPVPVTLTDEEADWMGWWRSAVWMRGLICRSCGWGFCWPVRRIPGSLSSDGGGCCGMHRVKRGR